MKIWWWLSNQLDPGLKKKSQIIFQAENTPMSRSLKRVYCCRKVKYQKQDQSTKNLMQQKTVDIECSFVVLVYLTKIQRLPIVSGTMEFGHRHGPCTQKLIVWKPNQTLKNNDQIKYVNCNKHLKNANHQKMKSNGAISCLNPRSGFKQKQQYIGNPD